MFVISRWVVANFSFGKIWNKKAAKMMNIHAKCFVRLKTTSSFALADFVSEIRQQLVHKIPYARTFDKVFYIFDITGKTCYSQHKYSLPLLLKQKNWLKYQQIPYVWFHHTSEFHDQASIANKLLRIYTLCTWVVHGYSLQLCCYGSSLY